MIGPVNREWNLTKDFKMKLELVLSKEETGKWLETGEEADRYRMIARSNIRQCLAGLFSEIEVVSHDRDEIFETIRKEKPATR